MEKMFTYDNLCNEAHPILVGAWLECILLIKLIIVDYKML